MFTRSGNPHRRSGVVVVFALVLLVVIIGFSALAVDVGYLYNVRGELQHTADAAALAAAMGLPNSGTAQSLALQYASLNQPNHGIVLNDSDVQVGNWNAQSAVFVRGVTPFNAVEVTVRRAELNGNPVTLFFAGILGITQTDVSASATATAEEDNCFNRGITAGRFVSIDIINLVDVVGPLCIYGRQANALDDYNVTGGNPDLIMGALDGRTMLIDDQGGPAQFLELDIQPTRSLRVNELIDGIQSGALLPPGTSVVVLSGPVTFGTQSGQIVPVSQTAYVINGSVMVAANFELRDVTIAARGTIQFKDHVLLNHPPPTSDGEAPLMILATQDVIMGVDAGLSGGAIIAGRDVNVVHNLLVTPNGSVPLGFSIEAGRDVIMRDWIEFRDLSLEFAPPFVAGFTSSTLVQ